MEELMQKVFIKAYQVNKKTKHTVFIDYSGHVNWLEISIHINGWKENSSPDIKIVIDLKYDEKDIVEKLSKTLEKLNSLYEEEK